MHRLAVTLILLALLATGPPAATAARHPPLVPDLVLVQDVGALGTAMSRFAHRLRAAASGPVAMRRAAPALRRELAAIHATGRRMAAYRVRDPVMERRRRAMARVIPRVSARGHLLVDAAVTGDPARTRRAAIALTQALVSLRSAMTG